MVTDKARLYRRDVADIIRRIDKAYPKASLIYARIVLALMDAADRTLAVSDLSEAIGKGRDSTSVQLAIARLAEMGIVRRELLPADGSGGPRYSVELLSSKPSAQ